MKRQLVTLFAFASFVLFAGADWRQFRGNDANGVSAEENVPSDLSNIAWSAELTGRGLSGPIVIGDRVILTSSSGFEQDRLHVRCFDAETGAELWERQFWATGRTQCHNKMCVATPQPASDGERIFAFYSSNDLVCLDLDGNLLWYRGLGHDYPNASNSLGMASSPVVVDETVIVQVESDAQAFAAGLDAATGLTRWQNERPSAANWTSPSILPREGNGGALAVLQSTRGLTAVRPKTGEEVFSYTDGAASIPSSTVLDNIIYAPSHGLTALKPIPGSSAPEMLWRSDNMGPGTASPIAYRGRVYTTNNAGVLRAADIRDGQRIWQLRLKGPFSATPVAAGGHLFFFNEEGTAFAVDVTGERGKIVSRHDLGETILCTPALADGAIYVRSDNHLWKIAP